MATTEKLFALSVCFFLYSDELRAMLRGQLGNARGFAGVSVIFHPPRSPALSWFRSLFQGKWRCANLQTAKPVNGRMREERA
jgi:hypothetical protein